MKFSQVFKISKHFDKERKKTTHTAFNKKRKSEKKWTLFYNRSFYKAL